MNAPQSLRSIGIASPMEIAFRDEQTYVRRVGSKLPAVPRTDRLLSCGGYDQVLVTGDTGGLGLLVSEWLAKVVGVHKITLVSRIGTVGMFDLLDGLRGRRELRVEESLCDVRRA